MAETLYFVDIAVSCIASWIPAEYVIKITFVLVYYVFSHDMSVTTTYTAQVFKYHTHISYTLGCGQILAPFSWESL